MKALNNMANFDDDDEKDSLEEAVDSADLEPIEDGDSVEAEPHHKADLMPIEENPEQEAEDAEAVQEDLATKKTPEQEFAEASDEEEASLKDDVPPQLPKVDSTNIPEAPKSKLDQYQHFMNEYRRLQEQRQKSNLIAGLMAAGGQIGQSMAGKYSGNFKPDLTGVELMKQQAAQPISDLETQQAVSSRGLQLQGLQNSYDPNSAQSKAVRQYLNQSVFKNNPLPDTVSAADAASLMKMVGKPSSTHLSQLPMVNQETGAKTMAIFNPSTGGFTDINGQPLGAGWVRDYRAQSVLDIATGERYGFSGGTGKLTAPLTGPGVNRPGAPTAGPGEQTMELSRPMLTAQQGKQLDTARHQFINEIKDDRNNLNATDRTIAALEAGSELGDLPREEQDQLNRAFGQKGHLSDQQVGVALGRPDWMNRFQNAISIGMNGKLTDENRQFLLDTLKVIRDQNQKYIDSKSQVYSNNLYNDFKSAPNLQKAKISPQAISKLLGVEAAQASAGQVKQDPKIAKFASEHQMDYPAARALLIKRGYQPQE